MSQYRRSLSAAGSPQVARAGVIEECRRGGADVLSYVRGAQCSVAAREPAFAEFDLNEHHARPTVVVLDVDRYVAGGKLLVIRRPRSRALCQHVRGPLEFELDANDSDGKSESVGERSLQRRRTVLAERHEQIEPECH